MMYILMPIIFMIGILGIALEEKININKAATALLMALLLWGIFALISIVCIPLVFVASTDVDRMALYLIPLQLVVWARFPEIVNGRIERTSAILIVVMFYALVQFTWLVYGNHAYCWVPYDNLLLPFSLRDVRTW